MEMVDMTLSCPGNSPRWAAFRVPCGGCFRHIVFETTEPRAWDGSLPEQGRAAPGERYSWTVVLQGEVGPAYYSDVVIIE